jgi:uncharacterized phiE125 gp8 family phage protein
MEYKVITPASAFPVTLAQARTHLRLTPYGTPESHPDDDYIDDFLIPSATAWVQEYLEALLATQTIEIALNTLKSKVELPYGNVQSVTSVKVLQDGVVTTISTAVYSLNDYVKPAYLYLNLGQSWPSYDEVDNAVKIQYVVGYATVPSPILSAILLIIGHLYENRQQNIVNMNVADLPMGIYHLLQPYRLNIGI